MTIDIGAEAAIRIAGEPDHTSIDRYELEAARRALRLLKHSLGSDRLYTIARRQAAEGNAFYREHVKRSNGEQATGTVVLEADGLTVPVFGEWMSRLFARHHALIDAHPEHYVIDSGDARGPHIVEMMGDHVVGFHMGVWDENSDGAGLRRSQMALDDDGTVFGAVAVAFRPAPNGMFAELSVTLPATCASRAVEQHLHHFAVEFRNWMALAATETRAND
jgi:hypothetical protein